MELTFDPAKNDRNITERGLSSRQVADLDWETAVSLEDTRRDYGERRVRVFGLIGQRLHVAVVTMRGTALRVISFRKANRDEVEWYEQEKR